MRKRFLAGAVAVVTLAGGATAFAVAGTDQPSTRPASAQQAEDDGWDRGGSTRDDGNDPGDDDGADDVAAARGARVTAGQAATTALRTVPGTAFSAELDAGRRGRVTWEIDVRAKDGTDHEVVVDARTGRVLSQHRDDEDQPGRAPAVTLAQAASTAGRTAHGTVVDVELERHWEVDVVTADGRLVQVSIDRGTGAAGPVTAADDERDDDGPADGGRHAGDRSDDRDRNNDGRDDGDRHGSDDSGWRDDGDRHGSDDD